MAPAYMNELCIQATVNKWSSTRRLSRRCELWFLEQRLHLVKGFWLCWTICMEPSTSWTQGFTINWHFAVQAKNVLFAKLLIYYVKYPLGIMTCYSAKQVVQIIIVVIIVIIIIWWWWWRWLTSMMTSLLYWDEWVRSTVTTIIIRCQSFSMKDATLSAT